VDLFEPGSGSQMHDNNGGILASGLFWTLPVPDRALRVSRDRRRATLEVDDLQVIDSFQFGGAFQTPARVSFRVDWRAIGPSVPQGSGTAVPPEDKRAWLGEMAPALSTGRFKGEEFGFAFRSDGQARTDRGGYAQLGRERNGAFL
jgi:hypothetical protein